MNDARFATAFGTVAEEYERGRPGYAPEALARVSRELALVSDAEVLDLAAGTGKLTRDLAGRFERVIAVEPLPEMRSELMRLVPSVDALDGTAERIPLPAGSVDAVFVAQAFHWFDGRRALAEIARVLRPQGGVALLWNTTPWERRETPWFARVDDVLERSRVDLSTLQRHASGRWREAFTDQTAFEPLKEAVEDNTRMMSRKDFLDGFASRSYVAALTGPDREALMTAVADLLDHPDAPIEAGRVIVPMRTACYWTRLTAAR